MKFAQWLAFRIAMLESVYLRAVVTEIVQCGSSLASRQHNIALGFYQALETVAKLQSLEKFKDLGDRNP
jgi:hypothetical protein